MGNKTIVTINREPSTFEGTPGKLFSSCGFSCCTMELPWYENEQNVSCIPLGTYEAVYYQSPSKGNVYKIKDVPGRTDVLIHVGNWAGDITQRLRSDSQGCILLGNMHSSIGGNQMAVINSKKTLHQFIEAMKRNPITLHIDSIKCAELHTPWGGR